MKRERGLFLDCGVDGWMGQTNKNRLTGREGGRERERERGLFFLLFYIGLIEEKYAITAAAAAAALSCVVLWYDNETIINIG